ncbi:RHS repeat domain-containing protein [Lysinibacillus sp. UGB7]|uniref:RHS repeat domain-containing protein n=1 Tax=Lysinibacillus sp. UGB7 TaxID=3411039 RepID=UPI003B7AC27F
MKEFAGEKAFNPFKYKGQYEDVETGLYYNRSGYYSPSEGMCTQIDPIGLASGNPPLYAYVGDTNSWIDPFEKLKDLKLRNLFIFIRRIRRFFKK